MPEIGASEARSHWPQLLKRVQAGERFVITLRNRPVAELIPYQPHQADKVRDAIDGMKAFQEAHRLKGLSVCQMIEERRRH